MLIEYKDEDNLFQGRTNCQNKENSNNDFFTYNDNKREKTLIYSQSDSAEKSLKKKTNEMSQVEQKQFNTNNSNANLNHNNNTHNDPMFNYILSNREITDEEITALPILQLIEEESNIFNGKVLTMNAGGLLGGRNRKDGVALFGFSSLLSTTKSFKNDFELNFPSSIVNQDYPYVFAIYYQREQKAYFIRAYSAKGSYNRILFVKLSNSNNLPIKQKEILSIGNTLFQISSSNSNKTLEIVNLNKKESNSFDKESVKEITIGRDVNSTIAFPKDKSISKIQTTIYYDDTSNNWVIVDGSKVKSSSNGTWVFGFHSFPISDQMIVEVLDMRIKFTINFNHN